VLCHGTDVLAKAEQPEYEKDLAGRFLREDLRSDDSEAALSLVQNTGENEDGDLFDSGLNGLSSDGVCNNNRHDVSASRIRKMKNEAGSDFFGPGANLRRRKAGAVRLERALGHLDFVQVHYRLHLGEALPDT
jgi:hypothetical protein